MALKIQLFKLQFKFKIQLFKPQMQLQECINTIVMVTYKFFIGHYDNDPDNTFP